MKPPVQSRFDGQDEQFVKSLSWVLLSFLGTSLKNVRRPGNEGGHFLLTPPSHWLGASSVHFPALDRSVKVECGASEDSAEQLEVSRWLPWKADRKETRFAVSCRRANSQIHKNSVETDKRFSPACSILVAYEPYTHDCTAAAMKHVKQSSCEDNVEP